eukprot:4898623-Amphidinium_carterae.1
MFLSPVAEGTTTGGLRGTPPECEPNITKDNHGDTSQGNLGPLDAFDERFERVPIHPRTQSHKADDKTKKGQQVSQDFSTFADTLPPYPVRV